MSIENVKKTIQAAMLIAFGYKPPLSIIQVSFHGIPYDVERLNPKKLNVVEFLECDFTVNDLREYNILRSPICSSYDDTMIIGYQYDLTIKNIHGYGHDGTIILMDYINV